MRPAHCPRARSSGYCRGYAVARAPPPRLLTRTIRCRRSRGSRRAPAPPRRTAPDSQARGLPRRAPVSSSAAPRVPLPYTNIISSRIQTCLKLRQVPRRGFRGQPPELRIFAVKNPCWRGLRHSCHVIATWRAVSASYPWSFSPQSLSSRAFAAARPETRQARRQPPAVTSPSRLWCTPARDSRGR